MRFVPPVPLSQHDFGRHSITSSARIYREHHIKRYIFAISFPKIALTTQVNTITTRFRQLLVHMTLPLLHASHADLPVHPSLSPFPAMIPSREPMYETNCVSLYVKGNSKECAVDKELKKLTRYLAFWTATSAVVGREWP